MNIECSRYCQRWKQLLKYEHRAQCSLLDKRLTVMKARELQKQGYCILNVELQIKGVFYGDKIARLSLKSGDRLPMHHQFNDGNQIILSRDHPLQSRYGVLKGSVLDRSKRFIDVVLYEHAFAQQSAQNASDVSVGDGVWRMDVGVDEQTINRMESALDIFHDEYQYHGNRLMRKIISTNYDHNNTLMMLDKRDIACYNPSYFKPLTPHSPSSSLRKRRKNPEISDDAQLAQFQHVLVEQVLSNIKHRIHNIDDIVSDDALREQIQCDIAEVFKTCDVSLNSSQRSAVQSSLQNVVSLIQGPPGTGKTKTAVELIYVSCKLQQLTQKYYQQFSPTTKRHTPSIRKPILATAFTNSGVDQLLSELLQKGLSVVRVGLPVRMHARVRSVCLPAHIEQHSKQRHLQRVEAQIASLNEQLNKIRADYKNLPRSTPSIRRVQKQRVTRILEQKQKCVSKKEQINEEITIDILRNADVVCATCVGCGGDVFMQCQRNQSLQFSLVVIDEASQTLEPSVLIPLMFSCKEHSRLVLIGDQKQLPPLVMSPEAKQMGLGWTLFDRLIAAHANNTALTHVPLFSNNLLSIQYRMHPHIAQWPNSVVYDNQIKNASQALSLTAFEIAGFVWPTKIEYFDRTNKERGCFREYNSPLMFVDVNKGKEFRRGADSSVCNTNEANMVLQIMRNIIETHMQQSPYDHEALRETLSRIGIITMYTSQRSLIHQKLMKLYQSFADGDIDTVDLEMFDVDIDTVDAFQGREKDLIILSCVRSNDTGNIGFMRDDRRLNVALTRARRGLIVIGNAETLMKGDRLWSNFITFIRNTGRIVSAQYIDHYLRTALFANDDDDDAECVETVVLRQICE